MNITFVSNEYPPRPHGGIGTFVYYLAHKFERLGHHVTVAGMWDRNTESDDDGVRVVTRASSQGKYYLDDRRSFRDWLAEDIASNRTDLVEVPEFDGMLPFRFQECPVVVRLHQSYSGIALHRLRPPNPVVYWCERRTLQCHPHWIAVSEFVLRYTRRLFLLRPRRANVIYNFAPPVPVPRQDVLNGFPRIGDFVLYVGKLTKGKGAFDLARAARSFLSRHPSLSLVYVGADTSRHGKVASRAIRDIVGSALSARVHFVGRRPHAEVAAWMAAARAYVQPSHLEAFSMTPLEAMQCGTPVIYTLCASGREAIDDGITGLLVDPSRPSDIAAAVNAILTDSVLTGKLVRNAKNVVRERFSIDLCAAATLRFYSAVLGRNSLQDQQ